MLNKIIAVAGPTASGKTALAVEIAKRVSGEVVSCDSMQIYRKMNIGTAKPDSEEMGGIPHHMIDIVEPWEEFSVAEFSQRARECIDDILRRKKVPVIAGGTGLYMDSVLSNIEFPEFEIDPGFRDKMERFAKENGKEALHKILEKKDPEAAEKIHFNNVRRVVRALEVCEATGKTFTQINEESRKTPVYDALVLGIDVPRDVLYDRINRRVDIMLERGLLEEVKSLKELGVARDTTAMQAIGYKEFFDFLEGYIEKEDAVEKIKMESRRYAKRQLTWFRRNESIRWVSNKSQEDIQKILEICEKFLKI